MNDIVVPSDTELIIKGIEALNASLGAAAALRFLSLLHRESTDYVAISRRLDKGQTIDDIFERARENWNLDSGGAEFQ